MSVFEVVVAVTVIQNELRQLILVLLKPLIPQMWYVAGLVLHAYREE